MGIIPHGESPWGWAPTIRFGMAVDAINVSETCYLTVVRYYITNLGTTMESQVRSFVAPPVYLSVAIYPLLTSLFPLRLAVCHALSLIFSTIYKRDQLDLVAIRHNGTRILAVTTPGLDTSKLLPLKGRWPTIH